MKWDPERNYHANVKTGMWIPVVVTINTVDYAVFAGFGGVDNVFKEGNSQHTGYELEFRTDDLFGLKVDDVVTINGDAYTVKTMPAYSDGSEYFSACDLKRTARSYPKRAILFPSGGAVPPPPPSNSSANKFVTRTAAQALGGQRIVRSVSGVLVDYADNTIEAHGDVITGFTVGAVGVGQPVQVQTEGELEFSGWSWVPNGLIWVGTNGLPTQTPPETVGTKFSARIAFAMTATRIFIEIEEPTYLE
jgi:hypothetical protein